MLAAVVLVAALFVDQPTGWVSGPEAAHLPDACTVARAEVAVLAAGTVAEPLRPTIAGPAEAGECRWRIDSGHVLGVYLGRYVRDGLHSGTSRARGDLSLRGVFGDQNGAAFRPGPRIGAFGDECAAAYVGQPSRPEDRGAVAVQARRANVIVLVYYGVPFDRVDGVHDDLTADDVTNAVAVAAAAVSAVSPG